VARLGWLDEAWTLITSGAMPCVSLSVTNRYSGTGYLADYRLEEVTLCPRGANPDAVVDTVWEEHLSKTVRLEYDAAHPLRTKTVFIEDGRILERPRRTVYM
jgi:hypothetical protein